MPESPWQFHHPTKLLFGVDSLAQLGEEASHLGKRAMLVSYADHAGIEDVIERVGEGLERSGLDVIPFFESEPDPLESTGRRGADFAVDAGVDVVVGVGGGSAMDAAKGIAGLAVSGRTPWDYSRSTRRQQPWRIPQGR